MQISHRGGDDAGHPACPRARARSSGENPPRYIASVLGKGGPVVIATRESVSLPEGAVERIDAYVNSTPVEARILLEVVSRAHLPLGLTLSVEMKVRTGTKRSSLSRTAASCRRFQRGAGSVWGHSHRHKTAVRILFAGIVRG